MALVVFVAFAAMPALASGAPVGRENGAVVPTGSEIYGTSAKFRFNLTSGEFVCEARLKGTVTTNDTSNGFKGDITVADFFEECGHSRIALQNRDLLWLRSVLGGTGR